MNKLPVLSLARRESELANAANQRAILNRPSELPTFEQKLGEIGLSPLKAQPIEILQVNVGKLCNMTCRHCHVDAGPDRKAENMDLETVNACIEAIKAGGISTLDLTGGAPEMNPHFKHFVTSARELDCHVIDRCNLTILLANGFKDMPEFLAENKVEIVASLPCYLEENADSQRGDGSFQKSITALRTLNELGYGKPDSDLKLTLVYNPVGASLPPAQQGLEVAYREQLRERYDIECSGLLTITNMPISRYLDYLFEENLYENYLKTLVNAFNPTAAEGVMCRQMLSVGWDGRLFDCDFNQMLDMPMSEGQPKHITEVDFQLLSNRTIQTSMHCYGCTAGAGSGCLGAIELN